MVVILSAAATEEDITKAKEDYKTYIKVTADVVNGLIAIGGEYHYDAEQELLEKGAKQASIWGGGVDLVARRIDYNAMINIRSGTNKSTEIHDETVKQQFAQLVKKFLPDYVV